MSKGTTIVCSMICRGPPGRGGQGDELLEWTPAASRGKRPDPGVLTHILIKSTDGSDTQAASSAAIRNEVFLQTGKDLNLVRRSRKIPWESGFIETFLWRMKEDYERGFHYELDCIRVREGFKSEAKDEDLEVLREAHQYWKVVSVKLGRSYHRWVQLGILGNDPDAMPYELVSTAFFSVIIPPVLDLALNEIADAPYLTSNNLSQISLDLIFEIVSSKVGRSTFRFWAPGAPVPSSNPNSVPEYVKKYRMHCFLLDVIAHYLLTARAGLRTTQAGTLLQVFKPLTAYLTDKNVSLEQFEKQALHSIANVLSSQKLAQASRDKIAIANILQPSIGFPLRTDKRRPFLQIFTIGCSPLIFTTLHSLVSYLLLAPSHPYSRLHPGVQTMSREQEREWLCRPELLRITIAESRPNCDGVVLAQSLWSAVDGMDKKSKVMLDITRQAGPGYVAVGGPPPPGSTTRLSQGLQTRLNRQGLGLSGIQEPTNLAYGTLGQLLRKADENTAPKPQTSVDIEIITDAAIINAIRMAPAGLFVVLIAAEKVLPDGADVVAKMGAFGMCWAAKEKDRLAKVLVIASKETIESTKDDNLATLTPEGEHGEVMAAWPFCQAAQEPGNPALKDFMSRVEDNEGPTKNTFGKVAKTGVHIVNIANEVIPARLIDAYITEAGLLNAVGCGMLSKERAEAESQLWD